MKYHFALAAAVLGILAAPGIAQASPQWQDDVLCSSNMAYRKMHPSACVDIAIGSHGGGAPTDVTTDSDGDGTPDFRDKHPDDPTQQRQGR